MWKVKLDDGVWLANGVGGSGITRVEAEAWLFPGITCKGAWTPAVSACGSYL